MKKKKSFSLKEDLLIQLFDKFSYPITKAAITESQKEEAIIITQVLWLYLITQKDSENNIYEILYLIANKSHEKAIGLRTLYFKMMKKSLTKVEIIKLHNHYKSSENFNKLEEWGISQEKLDIFR